MNDVFIAGIDMVPFGRYPEQSVPQLGARAALMALDDASLALRDVEAVYSGNLMQSAQMVGQRILREIGQTGVPVVNVANACATGATAFREACLSVMAGAHEIVLAVGVEKMGKGLLTGVGREDGFVEEGVTGSITTPAMFAQIGMAHARKYGTTIEQFAKVAVKNHYHATFNPKAMFRRETPLEEVLGSDMIAYPNTKLMCSLNVDGAAAAVVMSGKAMRRHGLTQRAIAIRASAMTSNPFVFEDDALTDFNAVTRSCAEKAYAQAGVGPADISLIELHDCFATAEIVHYENLKLCGEGDAARLLESGETTLGGKRPVNVSGGLLSKGHPLGATGIANLYEIALHLRGEAGKRQVENARIGLTHVCGGGSGLGSSCVIHVLERA